MNTIRIELSERHDGADIAATDWQDHHFTAAHPKASPLRMVARQLVAAGAPDVPWQATRRGRAVLSGPSLHRLAEFDVRDVDGSGLKRSRWTPNPRGCLTPPEAVRGAAGIVMPPECAEPLAGILSAGVETLAMLNHVGGC